MKKILITGVAGFIGYHLAKQLLIESSNKDVLVVGIDNMNDSYDINLKKDRLKALLVLNNFRFIKDDVSNKKVILEIIVQYKIDLIVNLAARAGVRNSISDPEPYFESNIHGFCNILEACKESKGNKVCEKYEGVKHLIYASSSSVYGKEKRIPFKEEFQTDKPISVYAATKKCNEILAYSYSRLFDIPCTGLRFFTVYGPLGRPDMAYYEFTNRMIEGKNINLFNYGNMYRDFTYVDDVVKAIQLIIQKEPKRQSDGTRYKIYNIGNGSPKTLKDFVCILEECLEEEKILTTKCKRNYIPMQQGDVYQTYADVNELVNDFSFRPSVSLRDGLRKFVRWYKDYYFL